MNSKLHDWVFGLLTLLAVGVAGFAIRSAVEANTKIALIEQRLAAADTRRDDQQDRTLRQHWKLLAWQERQINTLRVKAGMDVASDKPDLGN